MAGAQVSMVGLWVQLVPVAHPSGPSEDDVQRIAPPCMGPVHLHQSVAAAAHTPDIHIYCSKHATAPPRHTSADSIPPKHANNAFALPQRYPKAVAYDAVPVRSPPASHSCTGPCQASRTWNRVCHLRTPNLIAYRQQHRA
jgi:hypothetical protein